MNEDIIYVTDNSFAIDVLQSAVPVLVDFWAEWCGPCKMISPVLEAVAQDYRGKVKFVKVNVDENSKIPAEYDIRGIPTLILFKQGKVVATKVGAITKPQLIDFIDSNI